MCRDFFSFFNLRVKTEELASWFVVGVAVIVIVVEAGLVAVTLEGLVVIRVVVRRVVG